MNGRYHGGIPVSVGTVGNLVERSGTERPLGFSAALKNLAAVTVRFLEALTGTDGFDYNIARRFVAHCRVCPASRGTLATCEMRVYFAAFAMPCAG
jgi:hypothetical protein